MLFPMAIQWYELRDARTLSGKSQTQLAAEMGVSMRSVQNYENPERSIPLKGEHAIRRVLHDELRQLREMRESGTYESTATSSLPGPGGQDMQIIALNPRLAGISKSDMLRELLAREERDNEFLPPTLIPTEREAVVTPMRPDVGGLSDAQLAEYESAAGVDTTAPEEFDEESGDDRD